jgi:hypothetical protein
MLRSRLILLVPALAFLAACGPITSSSAISDAEKALTDARKAEAPEYAPYEFTKADTFLTKAKWLDGAGQFELAGKYARDAREAAQQSVEVAGPNRERKARFKGLKPGSPQPKGKTSIPGPTPSTGAP